ncbi:Sodium ion-translocating decarboxylase [Candidatus Magnetomorum sp. HK-1]|nr:Sodium ion-translocating decarboxylase [Candidatus Magnetomorum sp. HK-1]
MYGLEAISQHNGWAISVVGIFIVFTGLLTLSLVIRVFPKLIAIIEGNGKSDPSKESKDGIDEPKISPKMDNNIKEVVRQYRYLISWMGEPFSLPRLVELAGKRGLAKPYSTINQLIQANVIQPDGKGMFLWHAN